MTTWQVLATAVAILFGTHNMLVKRAAGRVPDAWGALVLEASAALVIALALAATAFVGTAPSAPRDAGGIALAALAGVFIGLGSILYFAVFRLGAPLSLAVPWVLIGWVMVVAVLGIATEGERLAWRHAAGLACGVATIWLLR
jgi:hypothetical protein